MNTFSAISLYPDLPNTVSFMMIGFCVVLGVLAIMSFMTSAISLPFTAKERRAKKAAEEAKKAKASAPAQAKQTGSAELAGVISSAVYSALDGAPHRVVSVSPAGESSSELVAVISAAAAVVLGSQCQVVSIRQTADFNWANSGRARIYSSHMPKK